MNTLINLFKKGCHNQNKNHIVNEDKEKIPTQTQINNIYLKIDQKNNFSQIKEEEISNIKISINKFKENEELIRNNVNKIMNKFLEKISNSIGNNDIFSVFLNISKLISKNNKIGKDNIDSVINYLTRSHKNKNNPKNNLYKSQTLILSKKKCEILGSVLCYSYLRLQQYKIKDINKLMELRKIIIAKGIDVHRDFAKYCQKNESKADLKITYYWKSQRNKYICLPELIFLVNRYSKVTEIVLDANLYDESLNEDATQTQLIELTLLSIHWLFGALKTFKINLINEGLEKILYENICFRRMNDFCSKINEPIKKNILLNFDFIFQKKWNFTDFFKLEEKRNLFNQEQIANQASNNSIPRLSTGFDDILNMEKTKSLPVFENARKTMINFGTLPLSSSFDLKKNNEKQKESHRAVVTRYRYTLELILTILYSISLTNNCNNLQIVMNDTYTTEFFTFFLNNLGFDKKEANFQDFNLFDLLIYNNKLTNIENLNIEINCLDVTAFENLLNLLYNNEKLNSIKISFFTSDATYFPQSLFKIFKDKELLKNNYGETKYLFENINNFEEKILNNLSTSFTFNLSLLFEIIKKLNLIEVFLNFDVPNNITNNQNYMNSILKFIINMLFLIFNTSKFKKICLLCPKTIFDKRKIPDINNIIDNINIENSLLLKELSLQFQFYNITNINNLISTRLQILNIGDLDIDTFQALCNNICNPIFNLNSSLQQLSIGLLKSITNFSIELKLLFRKLFNIKIKNLISLNLYTNLIINDEIDSDYFLQILNDNWISEYTILLNPDSEEVMNENFLNYQDKLIFFVPHNLERKLLDPDDIMKLNNNPLTLEVDNNKDYYDEAYWYLKYLFENIYVDKIKNEKRIKNMIMGILKYLYFVKEPKINFPYVRVGY